MRLVLMFAGDGAVGTLVARLRFGVCPAAVARFVVPVIVDPINRVPRGWLSTHVPKKRGVRVAPFLTHHDPAPAVVLEHLIRRVVTAFFRVRPRAILRRHLGSLRRIAVLKRAGGHHIVREASATAHLPEAKGIAADNMCVATVALTQPGGTLKAIHAATFYDDEPAESLTGDVFRLRRRVQLATEASATLGVSVSEFSRGNCRVATAVAEAYPFLPEGVSGDQVLNRQSAVSLTGQVNKERHGSAGTIPPNRRMSSLIHGTPRANAGASR